MKTINDIEVSDVSGELYDRLKSGEIVEADGTGDELLNLDLVETHARVWETRPCYVLKGFDPRREAIERILTDMWLEGDDADMYAAASRILAVL